MATTHATSLTGTDMSLRRIAATINAYENLGRAERFAVPHTPGSRMSADSPETPHALEPPRNIRPTTARQPPPTPTSFGHRLEQTPETPRSRPINQIGRDLVNSS